MKTLLQTLFFFLLVTQICFTQHVSPSASQGGWYQQNPLTTQNNLNDVTLFNENTGWTIGANGTVLKTTNGGIEWFPQSSGISYSLWGVSFIDETNGLAVGENGIIIKTINGGDEWSLQNSGTAYLLNDVCFISSDIAMAVGSSGTILKSIDSGLTWNNQSSGVNDDLSSIYFINQNIGWTVGGNKVLRTTDGGNTWIQNSTNADLYGLHFVDVNTGWVSGTNYDGSNWHGIILKTTNGGMTWTSQTSGIIQNLEDVYFSDLNNGWAVAGSYGGWGFQGGGMGIILKTDNGGLTWSRQTSGTKQSIHSVFFINSNKGVFVGDNGTVKYTGNGGVAWICPPGGSTNDWTDIFFSSPNNGLVIGDAGAILKTSNGGTNWTLVQNTFTNNIIAMCFTNANNGWLIGHLNADTSIILHTNDGGEIWAVNLICPVTILGISFIDTSVGYLAGYDPSIWPNGIILRTTDGGMNWTQSISDSLMDPDKIQFIDANNGWMKWTGVGSGSGSPWGGMAKTTDGGTTWIQKLDDDYNDFQFRDVNNGIAVARRYIYNTKSAYSMEDAEWGIINKTTDGGNTWSSDSIYSPAWDVHYINNNTIVILGKRFDDQVICYWSTDAGSTWNPRPTGIYEYLHHIFFIDEQNGWMIGNNGVIYHTTNGGNPVPVELNSFTATANGKEVTLNWSTATELNNQGFEVQRKFGSSNFVTIGSVKGLGTTTSPNNYTYVDKLLTSGKYFYRLKQIDFGGKYEYSQTVEVNWSPFTTYKLEQNFPNPFNPATTIGFGIMEKGNVRLSVLNILGEEIKVLLDEEKEAGYHSIDFNGSDLASSVYFYRIQAGSFIDTKKMILLR